MPRAILALLPLVALGLAAGSSAAQGSVQAAPRLSGTWKVTGSYVLAVNLSDRKAGDRFSESWRFTPRCPSGACDAVLHRFGQAIAMRRRGSSWTGTLRYTGRFSCGGRIYAKGTSYLSRWTVTVTRTERRAGSLVATRLTGVGATAGRSHNGIPCARTPVTSSEGVAFTAVLAA